MQFIRDHILSIILFLPLAGMIALYSRSNRGVKTIT